MADPADIRVLSGLGALTATATSTVSGSTCTAVVGETEVTVQVARDLTVAADDVLLVLRQGTQWWAIARLFAAAPTPPPPDPGPPPKPDIVTGTLVCAPVETRSYRATFGWRTDSDDVYQGEYGGWGLHTGCAFYGSKPRSLTGATVTSATVRVKRRTGGGYFAVAGTLVQITEDTRPSGAPTVTGGSAVTIPAVGAVSTITVPTAYAQDLVDGVTGGLGFYDADGSPYARTAGRSYWSAAWMLTIGWSRAT